MLMQVSEVGSCQEWIPVLECYFAITVQGKTLYWNAMNHYSPIRRNASRLLTCSCLNAHIHHVLLNYLSLRASKVHE